MYNKDRNEKLSNIINSTEYKSFLENIKIKILATQYEALKKVNHELISLYWFIGKDIVDKQEQFSWGKSIVKTLSDDLQKEFVGMKGFSSQNLWNMRQFYVSYKDNIKLQTLSREIGWSHNITVIQKCKNLYKYSKIYSGSNPVIVEGEVFRVEVQIASQTALETAQETAQENTREQILNLLRQNPKYTKFNLMHIVDKADGTIKEHIANLKQEGKLQRIGSTKSGYWEVQDGK